MSRKTRKPEPTTAQIIAEAKAFALTMWAPEPKPAATGIGSFFQVDREAARRFEIASSYAR